MNVRARTLAPFGKDRGERATMARGLAFLFSAGATLVAATLVLLPSSDGMNELGLWLPVTMAYVTAAALVAARERFGQRALQVVIAGGTLLITSCVIHDGEAGAAYPMMYVWVALYAHYFFSPVAATVETIFCGVAYAAAFALSDAVPDAGVHWVMGIGTLAVAGGLIGRLTETARIQTADLAAVAEMGAVEDVTEFAHAVCEGLRRSVNADAVVLLEPLDGGLRVTGLAGSREAARTLNEDAALQVLESAFAEGEPATVQRESEATLFGGTIVGLAQPVLREDQPVGVLGIAWSRPRRRVSERANMAAGLFATEASLAIERQQAKLRERERHALEINDNIVQGLVVAKYAAAGGHVEQAMQAIDDTLGRARHLITRQLDDVGSDGGSIRPGDLVRDEASSV